MSIDWIVLHRLPTMARKPRIDFPGAFYHVIVRGNQRATIFHDPEDHTGYLERLERYRRRAR